MSIEHISLSTKFKFFLTFHFSLGCSIEYSDNQIHQLRKLNYIAKVLNNSEKFTGYRWSAEEFDKQFPLSLQAKHGYLLGTLVGPTGIMREVITHEKVKSECVGFKLDSENIRENVVYFDHGVGSINFLIKGELEEEGGIERLGACALAIQKVIQNREVIQDEEKKSLRIFDKWNDFRDSMCQAFESCNALYDMWGIRLLPGEAKGRNPTRVVGTGALLSFDEESDLKFEPGNLEKGLVGFAGSSARKYNDFSNGIIYLAEGYDGHIAIVSNDDQETWLMNLWQFITDHYTMARDLEKYLYDWALSLSKEEQTFDPDGIRTVLEAIRRIELSINVITYEILPQNFAGVDDEKKVCDGIYNTWDTQTTVNSLNSKFETLSTRFNYYYTQLEQKAQQKSNKIQSKINYFVFFLTAFTLASVLSDIFVFKYDGSSLIDIIQRAWVILIPTLILAVALWISVKVALKKE